MNKRPPLTEEQKQIIREQCKTRTRSDFARQFGRPTHAVKVFCVSENIICKHAQLVKQKPTEMKVTKSKYFNVDEYFNESITV